MASIAGEGADFIPEPLEMGWTSRENRQKRYSQTE